MFLLILISICPWTANKLEVFHSNSVLASFCAVLSGPLVEREPTFDKKEIAFFQVLVDVLGGASEGSAVNEAGIVFLLTFPAAV
jgi:hypothetical protein